jgi:RND family efflux transporter MFP subunit
MRFSNRRISAFFLVGLVATGLAGCGGGDEVEEAPVARPISSIVVGESFAGRLTFPGTSQAADRAELSFRVAGPLVEFPVSEGDRVRRGQLLARIDPRDYQIATTEAKASHDQAKADAQRYQRLYEREAIPLADLEVRLARRDVAEARFEQAQADLRDTDLRAPFGGHIGRKYVENFEDVLAREPILSLHDIDQVEVVINVPESIMALVREGQNPSIMVAFDAAPDHLYQARVTEFAVNADPQTQTFAVTVTLPQPQEINVLPGMTATVAVSATISAEVDVSAPVAIPAHAVFSDESGNPNVWVVDPEALIVHRRPISLGPVTGTEGVTVLDGLAPGERIAIAGVHFLREGQPVRIIDLLGR